MSAFSEYLQQLMKERNYSITALARDVGINRSTLQKALSGERVLAYTSLTSVIQQLCLDAQERKKLKGYYHILLEGAGKYQLRKAINGMLRKLACIKPENDSYWEKSEMIPLAEYLQNRTVFSGDKNIRHLVKLVCMEAASEKGNHIKITMPCDESLIQECIGQLFCDYKKNTMVSQIIIFNSSDTDEANGLKKIQCFQNCFSLCFYAAQKDTRQKYQPFYFYDNVSLIGNFDPFPYFLATESKVICFSADFNEAILLQGRDQVDTYQRYFFKILRHCHPFLQCVPGERIENQASDEEEGSVFMLQASPYPKACMCKGQKCRQFLFFTEKGMMQQRQVWTILEREIREDIIYGRLIDEKEFVFPEFLKIRLQKPGGLRISFSGYCDKEWEFEVLEPHLCRLFSDWFHYLGNSECVFEKEETLNIIAKIMNAECDKIFK